MSEYQLACKQGDVAPGAMLLVELEDRLAIVFNIEGQFYCIDDVCTHDGGPLSDGELAGCTIACPRHGAKFDVTTGQALTMPATEDTVCHDVKLDGESVYVKIME
ncbi:MAG: non-heme iron oxygenase ferredoxin subunit [Pirellulaceae bacterium]